jgi:hypothetical protein
LILGRLESIALLSRPKSTSIQAGRSKTRVLLPKYCGWCVIISALRLV